MKAAKRVGLEVLGWGLVLLGIAGVLLPGPGLLPLFAGLLVLSQQYEWAEKRLDPVKYRALKSAAETVESPLRIVVSVCGVLVLVAMGVVWLLAPPQPSWWSLPAWTWLPGGTYAGVTFEISAVFAAGMIVYSYRRFSGKPEAVEALERQVQEADQEYAELRED